MDGQSILSTEISAQAEVQVEKADSSPCEEVRSVQDAGSIRWADTASLLVVTNRCLPGYPLCGAESTAFGLRSGDYLTPVSKGHTTAWTASSAPWVR